MVSGKSKGNAGEREVAKILTKWWGEKFSRRSMGVPGSDHIAPDGWPFANEVKNEKHHKVRHLFFPTKELRGCWQQALDQASKESRHPLLVLRLEGEWYWVVPQGLLDTHRAGSLLATWDTHDIAALTTDTFKEYKLLWAQLSLPRD